MAEKYMVKVGLQDGDYGHFEVLDVERVPLRLGSHNLFELVIPTPQGYKRVVIEARVEKYR